jgi:predicted aspartyl protease
MKSQTFDYNSNYVPAAPFAELIVHHEDDAIEPITIIAQIDTGADATMLPISVLEQVEALFESTRVAYDFSGQRHLTNLYAVSVTFAGQPFYLSVIAQENVAEGIIGRDILNHFVITLNGLAHVTEVVVE